MLCATHRESTFVNIELSFRKKRCWDTSDLSLRVLCTRTIGNQLNQTVVGQKWNHDLTCIPPIHACTTLT